MPKGSQKTNFNTTFSEHFDSVPVGILAISPEGKIIGLNTFAANLMGDEAGQLKGSAINSIISPDSATALSDFLHHIFQNGSNGHCKLVLNGTVNQKKFIRLDGSFEKETGCCMATMTDISEYETAREELLISNQRLELALDAADHGLWDWNLQTNKTFFSPRYYAMLGYEPGELPAEYNTWEQLLHPDDREHVVAEVKESVKRADIFELEFRLRTKSGTWKWIKGRGKFYNSGNSGSPTRLIGTHEDRSGQRSAMESLQISERKYRKLHESMMDGFVFVNMQGNILEFNQAYQAMLGYDAEELVRLRYFDLTPRQWHGYEQNIVNEQILPRGFSEIYQKEYIKKDGTLIAVELRTFLIKNDDGENEGMWAIVRDISKRKAAEEALRESESQLRELNATKDKFFSIIAHDLKSPFSSVIGLSELLVEKVKTKDFSGLDEYARVILRSSKHALDLLKNLMDWARSQTGRMDFNPEYFELVNFIRDVKYLFEPAASQKSITLECDLPPNAIVYADRSMFITVIRNLVSNAIKYTRPGGKVCIGVKEQTGGFLIFVQDNGIGVPANRLDKLFRIDEEISTPGTANERGTGLGLILCKEFIDKHSGRIWVESQQDSGSTFSIFIPENQTI